MSFLFAGALLLQGGGATDFSPAVEHGRVTVIQGHSAATRDTVTRAPGFTGEVTLALAGAPQQVTGSFSAEHELTLAIGRPAHVGDHVVTVRGVSGDSARTASFTVRALQSRPVAAAYAHTLAVAPDGGLWTWGQNEQGELGAGGTGDRASPTRIGTETGWVAAAGGRSATASHSAPTARSGRRGATRSSSSAWRAMTGPPSSESAANRTGWPWPRGSTTRRRSAPRATPRRHGRQLDGGSAGGSSVIALKADGSLWGWGHNISGQLELGRTDHQSTQQQLDRASDWVAIAVGDGFTLALKADGLLRASGGNLGTAAQHNLDAFAAVHGSGWQYVTAGGSHTLGVGADGAITGWGSNERGQLGHGATSPRGNGAVRAVMARWP